MGAEEGRFEILPISSMLWVARTEGSGLYSGKICRILRSTTTAPVIIKLP